MVETSTEHSGFTEQLTQHVCGVLRNKAVGKNNVDYLGLMQEITALKSAAFVGGSEATQHDLSNLVDILTACISALHEQRHTTLISEIFSIPLWEAIGDLRSSVLRFMLHLAVVNSTTTLHILQNMVLNLGLPWALAGQQEDVMGKEWHPSLKIQAVQSDIIETLEKILELVPVSSSLLLPVLARGLPNKVLARCMQCTYLRALLLIAELPKALPLRRQIIAAVVQHLISLDVEIRWHDIAFSLDDNDDEGEDKDEENDQDTDIFELEGHREDIQLDPSKFDGQQNGETWVNGQQQGAEASNRITGRSGFEGKVTDEMPSTSGREQIDETAEKLDSMMSQVFKHIDRCRQRGQLAGTWQALLDSFFATVLNTHRSKFTQYLLWYILDMDSERGSRAFLGRLLQILADSREPAITRSAAASYVASFLARAAFLSDSVLMEHTAKLASWCLSYCQRHDSLGNGVGYAGQGYVEAPPQGVIHQVFYAACQGLLYILCYRLEQLAASGDTGIREGIHNLFTQILPILLKSSLAPMAICLPTVVTEFTKLSARLGLLDCKPFHPSNAEAAHSQRPLEMFFPFDPYLLRRSAAFLDLRRTFLRWKSGHAEQQEEDNEDANDSNLSSDDDIDDSEISSSGLGSDSDGNSSEAEGGKEELAEAFQGLNPDDDSPDVIWHTVSQPIVAREPTPSLGASHSTNGNSSPTYPMSWTPKLPQSLSHHRHSLMRPLDTLE